ncbi:unnamed protein product [Ectocarpus sp. 8 AP-2014]
MKEDPNLLRVSTQPLYILEDHQTIYRLGRVFDPQHGFRLVPDCRYNVLERHNFVPGHLEGVPKEDGVMGRLLAGFVKTVEEEGMGDQIQPESPALSATRTMGAMTDACFTMTPMAACSWRTPTTRTAVA